MSPRTKDQFKKMREQSRTNILMAALELFGTKGYHATSISKVAKKAGVSKGLMYNYFDGKEGLLKGIMEMLMKQGDEVMNKQKEIDDPAEYMESIIRGFFEMLESQKHMWKLMFSMSMEVSELEFIREMTRRKTKEYINLMESLLSEMGLENVEEEALMLGALFDGIALHYIVLEKEYPMEKIKKRLIKKYCKK